MCIRDSPTTTTVRARGRMAGGLSAWRTCLRKARGPAREEDGRDRAPSDGARDARDAGAILDGGRGQRHALGGAH
eukprot:4718549-Prymnesium_polylepis.1